MLIIGCDYHPGFEQIAYVDSETGEFQERRLKHPEEAEKFYRALWEQSVKVRVGMDASGHARWFSAICAVCKEGENMSPLVHRSILKKFLIVVSCAFPICIDVLALAQHSAVRTAGGAFHNSAPPISHVPISSAPIIHAPIIYAPIPTPRMPVPPTAGALGTAGFRPPRRPIRPFPPGLVIYESPFLLGGPFWGLNSCWGATCDLFGSWTLGYTTVSSPGPTNYSSQVYETPVYVYGEERQDLPQLFLKDGTILNVTDYWLVDDQLHFKMIEEDGGKPAEHEIHFDALDLQTTVDANTRRGFRFMLRNEPFEQYLRDHPEGPPPVLTPPHE